MGAQTRESIAGDLEAFLRENFQIPENDNLFTRNAHLWEEGYVDSAGVVQTIAYLERRWRVTLPDEVIRDPSFTHIDGIADMVARLVEGVSAC